MKELGLAVGDDDVIEVDYYSEAGRRQEEIGELCEETDRARHFKKSQSVQIPTEIMVRESTMPAPADRT